MPKKNFEPLNELSGRHFFFLLKQEVVLCYGQTQATPKGPFRLKLCHPPFCVSPSGPSKGLSIPTPPQEQGTHSPSFYGKVTMFWGDKHSHRKKMHQIQYLCSSYYVPVLLWPLQACSEDTVMLHPCNCAMMCVLYFILGSWSNLPKATQAEGGKAMIWTKSPWPPKFIELSPCDAQADGHATGPWSSGSRPNPPAEDHVCFLGVCFVL